LITSTNEWEWVVEDGEAKVVGSSMWNSAESEGEDDGDGLVDEVEEE